MKDKAVHSESDTESEGSVKWDPVGDPVSTQSLSIQLETSNSKQSGNLQQGVSCFSVSIKAHSKNIWDSSIDKISLSLVGILYFHAQNPAGNIIQLRL